jgi:hypothetical protein
MCRMVGRGSIRRCAVGTAFRPGGRFFAAKPLFQNCYLNFAIFIEAA